MSDLKLATIGGGCFWCTEAVFQDLKGVRSVTSGYAGGHVENPTYRQVCGKLTGHAEVIQIEYDPEVISFETLLEVFWTTHDPTTLNQQGADKGPQYRSAIFYHDEEQRAVAERSKAEVAPTLWSDPVVTEVTAFSNFYAAEAEHHNFYKRNGNFHGYCTVVITPKVSKARQKFAGLMR